MMGRLGRLSLVVFFGACCFLTLVEAFAPPILVRSAAITVLQNDQRAEEMMALDHIQDCGTVCELYTVTTEMERYPNVAARALKRTIQLGGPNENDYKDDSKSKALIELCINVILKSFTREKELQEKQPPPPSLNIYSAATVIEYLSRLIYKHGPDQYQHYSIIQLLCWGHVQDNTTTSNISLSQLSPTRLTGLLMAVRHLPDAQTTPLYGQICKRLGQGDALAILDVRDLLRILNSVPKYDPPPSILQLVQVVCRRLRKQSVHGVASGRHLVGLLRCALTLWDLEPVRNHDRLVKELKIMVYNVAKKLVTDEASYLTPFQWSIVCRTVSTLLDLQPHDDLLQDLCAELNVCLESFSAQQRRRQQHFYAADLTSILSCLQIWNVYQPRLVRTIGRLYGSQLRHPDASRGFRRPALVSRLVSSAALLHARDPRVLKPYSDIGHALLVDPTFLQTCSVSVLSNLAWFVAFKARWNGQDDKEQEALVVLSKRLLERDVVNACNGRQACLILNAMATMCCLTIHPDPKLSEKVHELFQQYAQHLWSLKLTPLDLSYGITAYAKAMHAYVYDQSVFYHLTRSMADRVSEATPRQIAGCLWACGKLAAWDRGHRSPPFLENSTAMAKYLSSVAKILTPKDISQSLWALARLRLTDPEIVEPLLMQARFHADSMNAETTANIVWALSSIRSRDYPTVFALTRKYSTAEDGRLGDVKPEEASSILFAMGRLNLRDDEVFHNLTKVLIDNIDVVEAHVIANALWAYRRVLIPEPQTLIDIWANKRLGIIPLTDPSAEPRLYRNEATFVKRNQDKKGD